MFFSTLATPNALKDAGTLARTNVTEGVITIGHEAVMVFFVLSGFLVGGSVLKLMSRDLWSWNNYLIKRLTRLWIVLIPALLLGLALDLGGSHIFSGTASIYSSPAGSHSSARPILDPCTAPPYFWGIWVFFKTYSYPRQEPTLRCGVSQMNIT
jgi:peptidoglycan/LPS O-acetylase OafA/YrhL